MNAVFTFILQLLGLAPPPDKPGTPDDPCKAPSCVKAKKRLDDARRWFNSTCSYLRSINAISMALSQVIATPIWVFAVLAVIAAIIGGPLAIVIWALIAVYALSWFLLPVVGQIGSYLAADLVKARVEFNAARVEVVINCPEFCRGDMSEPECKLN
jgi:hypothetical protein